MPPSGPATILHAADLHLGAPLDALGARVPAAVAEHLRSRSREAFDNLVNVAIERQVDAVVLAGDVYDGADREVASQFRLAKGLGRLSEAGIRVFIAHGNHDPLLADMRLAKDLPAGVTVFGTNAPEVHELATRAGHTLHVAGVSFAKTAEQRNLAQMFHSLDTPVLSTIGVLHTNVGGNTGHDPYAPCTPADLQAAPVAYWALGHIHLRQVESMGLGRYWAYPGNLQGRSTKPAECGAKGALLVGFDASGALEPEFVALDAVRFQRLDVDVSSATNIGDALELLGGALSVAASDAGARSLVVKATLVGSTTAHRSLLDSASGLLELARENCSAGLGDGALLSVRVGTRPHVTRQELVDRGGLLAELLGAVDALRADPQLSDTLSSVDHDATRKIVSSTFAADPGAVSGVVDELERLLIDGLVED